MQLLVPTPNNTAKVNFGDIAQLRSDDEKTTVIRAIQVYAAEEVPLSFDQVPLATEAQLAQSFLVLFAEGEESIKSIPLVQLRNVYRSPVAAPAADSFWTAEKNQFMNLKVQWDKSYLQFSGGLGNGGQITFLFGIEYIYAAPGAYPKYLAVRDAAWAAGMLPQ